MSVEVDCAYAAYVQIGCLLSCFAGTWVSEQTIMSIHPQRNGSKNEKRHEKYRRGLEGVTLAYITVPNIPDAAGGGP